MILLIRNDVRGNGVGVEWSHLAHIRPPTDQQP